MREILQDQKETGPGQDGRATLSVEIRSLLEAARTGQLRRSGRGAEERLGRRLGFGRQPAKRRLFYQYLGRLVDTEGERVYDLIGTALAQAVGKRDPGNYFCRAIALKLREAGLAKARPKEDW